MLMLRSRKTFPAYTSCVVIPWRVTNPGASPCKFIMLPKTLPCTIVAKIRKSMLLREIITEFVPGAVAMVEHEF